QEARRWGPPGWMPPGQRRGGGGPPDGCRRGQEARWCGGLLMEAPGQEADGQEAGVGASGMMPLSARRRGGVGPP
ncbi:hypothetical protein CYMTET_19082, partial [Cymbomonas tetramitiformis]